MLDQLGSGCHVAVDLSPKARPLAAAPFESAVRLCRQADTSYVGQMTDSHLAVDQADSSWSSAGRGSQATIARRLR